MIVTLSGYQIAEMLHESAGSLIFRGWRQIDEQPVVLKVLKEDFPSPERLAWFKREYEVTRNLDLAGVVQIYSLEHNQRHWLMVLEDFGGDSLARLGVAGQVDISQFLELAIKVTDILAQIHRRRIIHKDINPSNIIFNSHTNALKFIDFGISTVLSRENSTFRNPNVLEGTLAYMSPEQTGRMNRAIDYRTDFYSLGVTFYELLTGRLPFQSNDALELVHSHIAKQPVSPQEVRPDLPPAISQIIMKLMAKNAEDRYQSAYGLKLDLEECLQQWQAQGRIEPFPPGKQDISDRFQIPQKLYGRDQEIETLLTAFERVSRPAPIGPGRENGVPPGRRPDGEKSQGKVELMLVAGYSGIGKSALVQEMYKPITRRRGFFISGKFDQFQRDIPYAALIRAFQSLMRQLLTESDTAIAAWREKILAALGPNGQVIIDVIPEVELIIGPQPEIPQLGPSQSLNRFNLVFQNFIRVFSQPGHPLVVFLDDLQWADGASLKLIELLMTEPDNAYLFLIGAYRDNETSESHPLMLSLAAIKEAEAIVNQINLSPLDLPHVSQLIAETLMAAPDQVESLANRVKSKTGGNPFFVNEFLKSLYTDGLINFDHRHRVWRWNLVQIQEQDITDNVVELMASKARKLPEGTQIVLQLAACIGNQFDLETLALVSESAPSETATALWAGIAEGMILPLSEVYKLVDISEDLPGLENLGGLVNYKFAHDRIQQAVYSLIPETERQTVHQRVGRLLLRNTTEEELHDKIFDIVNHLNQGRALVADQIELDRLAELNLIAGRKAKSATAYQPAVSYLKMGLDLLATDSWQANYQLTLNLYVEAAEAAYLSGDFAQNQALSEVVLQHARTVLDKVRVYEAQIQAHIAQIQMQQAVDIGLQVFEMLGVSLAESPPENLNIEALSALPEMTDPHKLAAMQLSMDLFPSFYIANPKLLPRLAFTMVKLCLEDGNSAAASFAYVFYGLLLCGRMGNIELGYQFGQLGLHILEKFQARELECKVIYMFNVTIRHWKEAAGLTIEALRHAMQVGLESGDIAWVGYAAYFYCANLPLVGEPLTVVSEKQRPYVELMGKIKQATALYSTQIWSQYVLNLRGQAPDKRILSGALFDESKMLPVLQETNNLSTLFRIYLVKTMLSYLFKDKESALTNARATAQYEHAAPGLFIVTQHPFYYSLILLSHYPTADPETQQQYLDLVAGHQEKMAMWAGHAPMNFQHKYNLVEAERARVLGRDWEAARLYEQAIAGARENGYIQEEALAYELAAEFYFDRDMAEIGQLYVTRAHYGYLSWQATAKVQDLEEQYPQYLVQAGEGKPDPSIVTTIPAIGTATGTRTSHALDLTSVLKASQAISGEIMLEGLLTTLMNIVIENAAAERGFLILDEGGRWVVQAEGAIDKNEVTVLQSIPIQTQGTSDRPELLPMSIINYIAHTQESVVLDDAARLGRFTRDPYIKARRPKSVLCMPLLNQGKLIGMLYLENNLAVGTFTPDRLEILNIFSSQAAISIENASLFSNLERSEKKYRTLFEDSKDTIFITTAAGQMIDINTAGLKLFGYTKEEILQLYAVDLYADPNDLGGFMQEMKQKGLVRDFETRLRKKDGIERDCLVTATARRTDDGDVLGYEGIIRDITGRKRAEKERLQLSAIQRELDVAHDIQARLLPPARPGWSALDVVCYSMPAREVGGDFYTYHAFDGAGDRSLFAVAVGDVSGKGMPAALLMSLSLASLETVISQNLNPGELLGQLDGVIARYTKTTGQNCALCYTRINKDRNGHIILSVANAGCITPIIRRIDGSIEWVDVGGMPLGVGVGAQFGYQEVSLNLSQGDLVILTSDGVVEANNIADEMLGFEKLEQAVAGGPMHSAEAMLDHLKSEVTTFVKGAEPHDDLTIIVMQA